MKKTYVLALALGSVLLCGAVSASELAVRWERLRAEQPRLTARDAASNLGVSEAELLATGIGQGVTRLREGELVPREIMRRALDLGPVMALTRNDYGVIERTGVATRLKAQEQVTGLDADKDQEREARLRNIAGGYLGGPIDLRFTFRNWKHAFAVAQPGKDGVISRSLQFFDGQGNAVHKLYVKSEAGTAMFDQMVAEFRHPQQQAPLQITAAPVRAPERPDSAIDVQEYRLAWQDMNDVHQFNRLLGEFGVSREQAMRLAPAGAARAIAPQAVRQLLEQAAQQQVEIMAFLGNEGTIQIYSGKIGKVQEAGGWFNVLDPQFNLHLRDNAFRSAYVIRRAGVTSVDFYDQRGDLVVSFFGVRAPGKPQPQSWLDLTAALPQAPGTAGQASLQASR
ncbi:hemin-degrading factor [Pseudoduganella danionis]|uniref:Hemin-degrading factor n=1 Tax=Pseudoduganella danionis TaxID=1890295 RepID=A0ABW9SMZ8_9BURK|nr:ChuX/HutX family heme-like substrate-binding protein [Pseudoduganella danionis]MTW32037.1 hemin-degrading factor [Pseudoduganella danionis]